MSNGKETNEYITQEYTLPFWRIDIKCTYGMDAGCLWKTKK